MLNGYNGTMTTGSPHKPPKVQHPKFYLDDGSLILCVESTVFKIHKTLLYRHSRVLPTLNQSSSKIDSVKFSTSECVIVNIPDEMELRVDDFEALLEHLYHDV